MTENLVNSKEARIKYLDQDKISRDFPILKRKVKGKRLVYLDSAATSQKPRQVIQKISEYYERYNANPHRGIHTLSGESTEAYEGARTRLARFLNAPANGVVFTKNCTEAINLVAYSWARRRLVAGDEILCTVMDHHSNIVPWQMVAADTGVKLRYVPVTDEGDLDLSKLDELVTGKTRLVAVTGASNVLGTITQLESLIESARAVGALVLVDGAQLVPHVPVDFKAMGADFLAIAGHKMLGPTGIGALVARPELLEEMEPFLGGGGMILDLTLEGSKWIEPPWKFEAGTPMVAEAIGLRAAVDYLEEIGMEAIRQHEKKLVNYALKEFAKIEDFHLYGELGPERHTATFSFNIGDSRGGIIHPHDVGTYFDSLGLAIRAGHHCAKPLMRRFKVVSMSRASCYLYNSESDIDKLVDAIHKARKFFTGV